MTEIRDVSYTLYIIEKIGLPLLLATFREGVSKAEEVTIIRDMLERCVQLTQEMEKHLAVPDKSKVLPSLKLRLASIASETIASKFKTEGTVLSQRDIEDLMNNLELVLSRAENFDFQQQLQADSDKNNGNLSRPDEQQKLNIRHLAAFIPILHAINGFSYGENEKKLIQSVSDILLKHSKEMFFRLNGTIVDGILEKHAQSVFLEILATIYAETHEAETKKIMRMNEKTRLDNGSQLTIDIVWRAFDKKCAMLEALIEGLIPTQKNHEKQQDIVQSDSLFSDAAQKRQSDGPLSFYKKTSKT